MNSRGRWRVMQTGIVVVLFAPAVWAYNATDRTRPASAPQLLVQPESSILIESQLTLHSPPFSKKFDESIKNYFSADTCPGLLSDLHGKDYEELDANLLARLGACEPPGKDPEKMFTYAEKKAPSDDIILLLHARYLLKHERPAANDVFARLFKMTSREDLRDLSEPYLPVPEPEKRKASNLDYTLRGQIGGMEEANPRGLALSNPEFGDDVSTAGLAGFASAFRRKFDRFTVSSNYLIDDTTYWKVHAADFLSQDIDLPVEWKTREDTSVGIRPFGSFYMLGGARNYTANGVGLVRSSSGRTSDNWLQASFYQDNFWSDGSIGSHLRADWRGTLKGFPLFNPSMAAYVDYDHSGSNARILPGATVASTIPLTHTEYGLSVQLVREVHRYSVGLAVRAAFRQDSNQTVLIDQYGNTTETLRFDFQVVVRPSLTIPLVKGLDLYMYFESNSIASNLGAASGLDRNISDNLMAALLRASFSNY